MNKQLSTVIFDVDDTLYDQHLPFKQALVNSFDYPFTETDIGMSTQNCTTFLRSATRTIAS